MNAYDAYARGAQTWEEYERRDDDQARQAEARRARLDQFWEYERENWVEMPEFQKQPERGQLRLDFTPEAR